MSGNDEGTEFGGLGSPMDPPSFDASGLGDDADDAFSIDLPEDDDPPEPAARAKAPRDNGERGAGNDAGGDFGAEQSPGARKRGAVMDLPIDVIVSVGRARPLLTELVELRRDSVLSLESRIDDPVELIVGDRIIARGELQEIEPETGRLGVRLTEVADPQDGL